jgi:hypothetical protein
MRSHDVEVMIGPKLMCGYRSLAARPFLAAGGLLQIAGCSVDKSEEDVMQLRNAFALGLCAAGLAAVTSAEVQSQQLPRLNGQLQVAPETPVAPSRASDHKLTFSGPLALPGVSLGPGTYTFRLSEGRTVQVLSADGSTPYAWLHTLPASRATATVDYDVWFGEPLAAGAPRRLTAWFQPGRLNGYELIYPTRPARPSEATIARTAE